MPSSVTKEDIRDELYKAGIRSSFIMSRVMGVIEIYALQAARRAGRELESMPIAPDPYGHLAPGEADLQLQVTRCGTCCKVKEWKLFRRDPSAPSLHTSVCISCLRGPHYHHVPQEQRRWFCPGCERKRLSGEFPPEKLKNPRIRVKCLECAPVTENPPAG